MKGSGPPLGLADQSHDLLRAGWAPSARDAGVKASGFVRVLWGNLGGMNEGRK